MNRLHYTKSRKQMFYERVISLIVVFFAVGVVIGVILSNALHRCEIVEAVTTDYEIIVIDETQEENQAKTATEAESESTLKYLGCFKTTAYCACPECCEKPQNAPDYGITATSTKATQGRTIAVDPSVIPYGTKVIIDGHEYTAEDCDGAIKGNRIDIYFDSHTEANNFGVQYKDIYIY